MIGAVIEVVLSKAISLANDQISAVLGVKEDLESLAKKIEMIHAMISNAEIRSTTNKIIEVWLKDLKDAASDADDLLDEIDYQVLSKKILKGKKDKVRSFFSSSNPLLFHSKMPSKIKKIKLQMNEIFKTAKEIGLRPVEITNAPNDPTRVLLTDRYVDDSKIVGRGDDVSEIVSQLTCSKDENNLSVIGIVGMGGKGKTTLAQLLMENDEVKKHFERTVWTCVSDDYNVDRVLEHMLQSLTGEASQLTNREAKVKKLSTELQGKRCLLVLDDVWSEDSELWDHMNNSLQAIGCSSGSKIIVTTRNDAVVTIMNGFVYRLGFLSQKASKELFEKMAFGNGRVAKTPQLVEIGERIVARCGGVPLALKAIGGLMSSRGDEREWLKIEESNIWSTLDRIHSAIKLSFDHLPSLSLKQCFAYCSIFPKDSVIDKNDAIQQWMAHGFLNPSSGSDLEMEDIGNNYFKILLQRSLLQEAEFDKYGNIKSCKMHDLVHDFALETSKGHCLTARVGELRDAVKAAHLTIVPGGSNNLNISEKNFSRLRTLHLSEDFSSHNFLVHCKCKYLRVLTMSGEEMEELPISIAKMKHLRYLDISGTSICEVPEFISKLYNLQTLKLPFWSNLPKDFLRLVNLRHLHINRDYRTHGLYSPPLVPGISQLTSLRTLNCFGVSRDKGCQIEELCSLNHLEGSLRIIGLENVANGDDASRANLLGKRNIESLELVWSDNNTEESSNDESILECLQPHTCLKALRIENFKGRSLLSWIPLLRNLTSIKLYNLKNCEQIPALGHLEFLRILRIRKMSSIKCIGNDFYGWPNPNVVRANSSQTSVVVFPSLKELAFIGMPSLEEWSVVSSCLVELFPSLEELEIRRCPYLSRLPEGLFSDSIGLVSLRVDRCYKLVSIPDLSSCQSLKYIDISNCQELLSLPHGIESCKSIQYLTITCPVSAMGSLLHSLINLRVLTLTLSNDIIDHHVPTEPISNVSEDDIREYNDPFSTLENLTLYGCDVPQIKSLPEQIQCLTALRYLGLVRFEGLETLPEWMSNFRSLEILCMRDCNSLANFPSVEVMQGLFNLKRLEISYCPILKQRCERETGAEWHKIAHIPEIDIDFR